MMNFKLEKILQVSFVLSASASLPLVITFAQAYADYLTLPMLLQFENPKITYVVITFINNFVFSFLMCIVFCMGLKKINLFHFWRLGYAAMLLGFFYLLHDQTLVSGTIVTLFGASLGWWITPVRNISSAKIE